MSSRATTSGEDPPLVSPLPDDIILNCVARVSRCYHPNLSLVSTRFRSLLASPELYASRSNHGLAESSLYLGFTTPPDHLSLWFTLRRTPHLTLKGATSAKTTGYRLVPVSSFASPPLLGSSVVSVGSEIYVIGGSLDGVPSSRVWVLDCRFHTWRRAPDMSVSREYAAAGEIDGKIHVISGYGADKKKWVEVFDPKTQTWESVTGPDMNIGGVKATGMAVLEGKLCFMAGRKNFIYDPKQGTLEMAGQAGLFLHWRWGSRSWCVIDNELYCCDSMGKIRGYDMKERVWREVNGLEVLHKFLWLCAAMVNYDGKLCVFWNGHWDSGGRGNSEIWCAEIALERRFGGEIWGSVEWSDVVLIADNMSLNLHSFTVTV